MVGFDLCNIYRGSKSFCYPCGVLESKRQRKTLLPVSLIGALTNHTKGIAFPFYSFYLIDGVVFFNNLCEAHSMEDVFEKVQRRALG
ncbi:uncharacterized protein [Gossypium hirsutum]|uniref:Uncharacterized protein isoform X2 n=1 Tax=Gossypium hirsutum TaxID=3635 RepID=A0ABM2YWD1_GOSHI|nr:uncharacterized protein LOC121208298 isoform X2 [Gossypium hirsutum]